MTVNKKPIMVLGCTSDAGKSLIVTAICRLLTNRGINVAPFKAQNMSNNAAITEDGAEIGRAQYLQAIAAKTTPSVLMNPVLLKPSAETYSQVIINGKVDTAISNMPWMARKKLIWPKVLTALTELQAHYEQVVIEGAGSPAEINLREGDIVNMSVALACQADVYLVSDIDRGGSFAHLLGTWACLAEEEQKLIKGFVLNKFRGDPSLLGNAMDWLEEKTGIPTVANLPYHRHHLPEEDSFRLGTTWQYGAINVALIYYPYASNMDEFDALTYQDDINLVPVQKHQDLSVFDAIILPGSKNSGKSLGFLREVGLDSEIIKFSQSGKLTLGICGGLQILGCQINDPLSLEDGDKKGLGVINLSTTLAHNKATKQRKLAWLGQTIDAYEIHHGESVLLNDSVTPFIDADIGWQQANIYTSYLHGLFDNAVFYNWFMEQLGVAQNGINWKTHIDKELDRLADMFEQHGWL
ncbi:cobyric acid synthase [Psychromonas sp. 14N.309.X.WAT.B.A12]|uniref:cobyric acid synthase n=1 Tax=Psychromonas sp. 14N.309.X.WAT.B.A12 TaxID=2998322 RepID=UPI0025AF6F42|nr:cobyric acid synthase [Psychromonas sp. 14N.309.X.WAT.B.A12]MDN2662029.1 cobyric acid synthase [Psychromonas sp. 14N.309.X.WAT.B.A12]